MAQAIGVLFGGASSEYAVSLRSATHIFEVLAAMPDYQVYPIGISKEGVFYFYEGPIEAIAEDRWQQDAWLSRLAFLPDPKRRGMQLYREGRLERFISLDVVFPVMHGRFGEDGSIQGFFDVLGIPLVGCPVLASAVLMDKAIARSLFAEAGLPQTAWRSLHAEVYRRQPQSALDALIEGFTYPVFVKPANAGSSMGVSKVLGREDLEPAIQKAFREDEKLLLEAAVQGRELECAILEPSPEREALYVSRPGEICSAGDFYDYAAKYDDIGSKTLVPAQLPEGVAQRMQAMAKKAFRACDGAGIARADFFLREADGAILLNELNTMPGFTSISMYPMLLEADGYSPTAWMQALIDRALLARPR